MITKSLGQVEIKDATKGEVSAVFSRFDVIDRDGDVTLRGAFEDGAPVRISAYQHKSWEGALPVGKGVVRVTDAEAILEGRFFMNTAAGRDTFEVVKEMGTLQEWSYGFDIEESSVEERDGKQVRVLEKSKIYEVSPVLLGAGIGTRTLAVKGADPLKFGEEAQAVVAAVGSLTERAADVMAKRREKGKGLGADSAALLELVEAELKKLSVLLTSDIAPDITSELQREYLRYLAKSHAA
jgi:HK97 family phage prohead protease